MAEVSLARTTASSFAATRLPTKCVSTTGRRYVQRAATRSSWIGCAGLSWPGVASALRKLIGLVPCQGTRPTGMPPSKSKRLAAPSLFCSGWDQHALLGALSGIPEGDDAAAFTGGRLDRVQGRALSSLFLCSSKSSLNSPSPKCPQIPGCLDVLHPSSVVLASLGFCEPVPKRHKTHLRLPRCGLHALCFC